MNIFEKPAIIPVLVIEELGDAVPLAQALVSGGLRILEVTLRTPYALDALKLMKEAVSEALVGLGTITSPAELEAATEAGADFGVSPGTTSALLRTLGTSALPFLPGAQSVSEMMALAEAGFSYQKFFPAEAMGGVKMLKSLTTVLPSIKFCPTGGITETNAGAYFELSNVFALGGSWIAPQKLIREGNWGEIERRAQRAAAISG